MKRNLIFWLLITSSFNITNAQTKKTFTKDIDVLYKKYKHQDSVTIQNASIQLTFSINKIVDSKGLPEKIILTCNTGFQHSNIYFSAQAILKHLEEMKEKSGYRFIDYATIPFYGDKTNILVAVYQKGTQYAKYGIQQNDYTFNYSQDEVQNKYYEKVRLANDIKGDFIYMEVGDMSRVDETTIEPFKF